MKGKLKITAALLAGLFLLAVAARADFCGLALDTSSPSVLQAVEVFDYGECGG